MIKHDWNTVNREVHGIPDISLQDLMEEIAFILSQDSTKNIHRLIVKLDNGEYDLVGKIITNALRKAVKK